MTPNASRSETAGQTVTPEILFEPATFGSVELSNRIVMAPMTRSKSPGGVPGEDVAAYYRRRTEGGTGLIITEGTVVGHKASNGYPAVPFIYGAEALAGWKRVVDEVHAAGGKIAPQLWHVGSMRQRGMEPDPDVPGYGPSAVRHPSHPEKAELPVEMTQADIDEVVEAFAEGAANSKAVGFDGVEVHGAHSYLLDEFFWSHTNRRTDGYGGSIEARTRFTCEIIRAIRDRVGPDFPICLRFSQWKIGDFDARLAETPQELERFLAPLVEAGVDVFHASNRRFHEPEFEDSDLNLAGWTKKITGKTTITVGSVGLDVDFMRTWTDKKANAVGIENLLERLDRDEFDLVAVGRALISDAAWPQKIRAGEGETIRPYSNASLETLE